MMEDVKYCAPVSGEIVEVKRGDKKKIAGNKNSC
jgi:Na+-transporting NADH:ubiquinone oxidoreductase subunit NqrA